MAVIIPAIDIIDGRAVRLYKGDYKSKTEYGFPLEIAKTFKKMGAEMLHIVDLDGAKSGTLVNFDLIKKLSEIMPIQVGGGIRDEQAVKRYSAFAKRIILGTIAVKNTDFVADMIKKYGSDKICVGVDVKEESVSTDGWLSNSHINYLEFIDKLIGIGVKTIIATDISRDGTLTSPNWEMYDSIGGINVIVSGGVACNEDVLKAKKYHGVIVGRAYYEGKVDLERLLRGE